MTYVRNEWMKLWAQKSSWAMLILMLLILGVYGVLEKIDDNKYNYEDNWQQLMQDDINAYEQWMIEDPTTDLTDEIALLQYKLDNNISTDYVQTYVDFTAFGASMLTIISIFSVVIAAGIVSNEFSSGTIKMLLTGGVARWKILLSKLVTVILYGLFLYAISIVISSLIGLILFGTGPSTVVTLENGQFVETSAWVGIGQTMLYSMSDFMMTILLAFLIGSLFKSSTLAVGITLLLMLMSSTIVLLLSKYEFMKFIWIANTDLTQYLDGREPLLSGNTLGFSLTINIVYAIIFLALTFITFQKRDVTA